MIRVTRAKRDVLTPDILNTDEMADDQSRFEKASLVLAPKVFADAVMVASNGEMVCFTFGTHQGAYGGDPDTSDAQCIVFIPFGMAEEIGAKLQKLSEEVKRVKKKKRPSAVKKESISE